MGKNTNWSAMHGVGYQCWCSPKHLCGLGSSLSKELNWKQSFHAIQSISGRQHGKAMTCVCSFTSVGKMFYRLLQGNQRLKSAGKFSHLYFSWICSPISVMEQFVLCLGPLRFFVSSMLCCWPMSVFAPDDPLLWYYFLLCVKVTTVSLFLDHVRSGLPSLFITRQNYSNKGTLTSNAFSCSVSPW